MIKIKLKLDQVKMIDLRCNRNCRTWGMKLVEVRRGDMFLWDAAIFVYHAVATVVVTSKGGYQK